MEAQLGIGSTDGVEHFFDGESLFIEDYYNRLRLGTFDDLIAKYSVIIIKLYDTVYLVISREVERIRVLFIIADICFPEKKPHVQAREVLLTGDLQHVCSREADRGKGATMAIASSVYETKALLSLNLDYATLVAKYREEITLITQVETAYRDVKQAK